MKRLALLAAVVVALVSCRLPQPPDTSQSVNVNIFGPSGGGGPVVTPPGGASPSKVNLGCFGCVDSGGAALPPCGANLATYTAPVGTKCTLDATPLDAQGNKIDGLSVEGWQVAGAACVITGTDSGSDGFNPSIEIVDVGGCAVAVKVAGVTGGPRQFVGQ